MKGLQTAGHIQNIRQEIWFAQDVKHPLSTTPPQISVFYLETITAWKL